MKNNLRLATGIACSETCSDTFLEVFVCKVCAPHRSHIHSLALSRTKPYSATPKPECEARQSHAKKTHIHSTHDHCDLLCFKIQPAYTRFNQQRPLDDALVFVTSVCAHSSLPGLTYTVGYSEQEAHLAKQDAALIVFPPSFS